MPWVGAMKIEQPPTIPELIDQSHEAEADAPRRHLGCSLVGHHCDRWIWLSFRWAVLEKFPGRILRLFRRGHMEEDTIQADLERIGVKFESRQSRVVFPWFVEGSTDGIITGVPGAEKTRHLLECKTHSKKSFDKLEKEGLFKSKPQHWAQMQAYMKGEGLTRGLYYAVCKDNDKVYTERVKYDAGEAAAIVKRGQWIAQSQRMPEPPIRYSATWWQCKFCPAHGLCWENKGSAEKSCRTCHYWEPQEDGTAFCMEMGHGIRDESGCLGHEPHPDLVPAERLVRKGRF